MTLQQGVPSGRSRAAADAARGWALFNRWLGLFVRYLWALWLLLGAMWLWVHALQLADSAAGLVTLPLLRRVDLVHAAAIGVGALSVLVFLVLVADEICPGAPPWFRRVAWGIASAVTVLCLLGVGLTIWMYRT